MTLNNDDLLISAARVGRLSEVKELLEKEANIEARDSDGYTSLHRAAEGGHLEIVKFLIEKGANIEARDSDGYTSLHRATGEGHLEIVEFLIEKGANIEARGAKNETPLGVASRASRLDTLQLLLNRGANVNVQDEDQGTPLHHAAYFGKGVELIIGKGANIEAKDINDCTPLHYAAWGGQLENARFLVDNGANINAVCHTNRRKPIHVAAVSGHENVIEFFISKGINVNDVATGNGWTSLHYAASAGKLDAVKTLVEKGANIGAKNKDGKNPLDVANQDGKSQVAGFLRPLMPTTTPPTTTRPLRRRNCNGWDKFWSPGWCAELVRRRRSMDQSHIEPPFSTNSDNQALAPNITRALPSLNLESKIKGSTESPALGVPEVNAALVNNTIILGILAAGLFNKTQHKQPIHENLLSPREQSMRLNNIDEDMIIRAMQQSEEFGDPDTKMDEVKISGNKTGMCRR